MSTLASANPFPSMPPATNKDRDWRLSLILGLLTTGGVVGGAGGIPYISKMQDRMDTMRESQIRLEEQNHSQQEKIEQIQKTLEAIRARLEAKGIVNRVIGDASSVVDQHYVERGSK